MPSSMPGKLQITAPDEAPRTVILDKPVLRIGRMPEPENDLSLAHGLVSRRHVQIFCDREPYRIVDLESRNGTKVNDLPLPANQPRELHDGDRIAIGPFTLTFEAPHTEEALPEPQPVQEEEPFGGLRVEEAPGLPPPPVGPAASPDQAGPPIAPARAAGPPVEPWVGMPADRSRWLGHLPPIYAEDEFLGRYLLIFEDLFGPLDQIIAHLDLYLDPRTAPESFLPTLADWLGLSLDDRWPTERRRAILRTAVELYDLRGTRKGLIRLLQASTECQVEIAENADGPHTFRVILTPPSGLAVDEQMVRHLIETNKPAHTLYMLEIRSAN